MKIKNVIPAKAGIHFLFFLIPSLAFACPVCFSGKGASLHAYRLSTLFLTVLPLIVIVSSFYWFYRQLKKKGDL
jgi:hypothetical protein